jgi:hypothetical protein
MVSSSANLAAMQQQHAQALHAQLQQQQEQPYQQYQQYQQQQHAQGALSPSQQHLHQHGHHHATPGHSRSTSDGGLAGFVAISSSRSGSGNLLSLLKQQQGQGGASGGGGMHIVPAPVAPSMPRAEMTLLPPAMLQRCGLQGAAAF